MKISSNSQKKISSIKKKIVDVSVAINHAAFVVAGGYVITLGDNTYGQLGLGNTKDSNNEITVVSKVADKFVTVRMTSKISS